MPESTNVPAASIVYSCTNPAGISSITTASRSVSAPTVIASRASIPPTRRARMPASSSIPPLSTAHEITTTKNTSSVRQAGTPLAMPARALTTASRMEDQREPAGSTSQAASTCTSAVTSTNPLNTDSPTGAE